MISFLKKGHKYQLVMIILLFVLCISGGEKKDDLAQIFAFAFFVLLCLFYANLLETSKDLIIKQSYKLEMTVCL